MSGVVAISVWSMAAASAAAALAVTIIQKNNYSVSIKNKYYCIGINCLVYYLMKLLPTGMVFNFKALFLNRVVGHEI